jgi:hypothetical protein
MRKWLVLLTLCIPAMAQRYGPFSINGNSQCVLVGVSSSSSSTAVISVSGTWSATLQAEVQVQGAPYANVQVTPSTSSTAQSTITANGSYSAPVAGYDAFQVCSTAYTSGTAVIYINITTGIATNLLGGGGGGGGTVTQVNSGTGLTGGPITTSGTLAIDSTVATLTGAQALTNKDLTGAGNTFPTFNQNTTGSAAKWTTPRLLAGNSVDGSANVPFANAFIAQGTTDSGLSGAQFLGALATGILKNTTTTGVLSIAVAGDFPTLNQNTTGSAAKWTTARNLAGNSVDGSANVAFSNAFIVQGTADAGLSGAQFLGALATGLLKNTTTTGVLSAAASADVIALFSSCSGTQYLGADGTCHTGNAGTVTGCSFTGGLISCSGSTTTASTVAGTSGGIPYFSSGTTWASSGALTQFGVLFGGGAAGSPTSSAQGGANFPLIGQGAANPIFSTIAYPTSLTSGGFLYASSTTAFASSALIAANVLPKSGGAGTAPLASSITDNGTTVATTEPITATSIATGTSPPTCTVGTAGAWCSGEGTAATAAASVDDLHGDSTLHAMTVNNNNTGEMAVSRTLCVNVTPVTVAANVTTDQNLQACSLSANLLNVVGRTLKVYVAGNFSTAAASVASLTFKVKLCTVSGCGSGTVISPITTATGATSALTASSLSFSQTSLISTQTAGASSAYEAHGALTIDLSATAATSDSIYGDTNTATVGTIDSTAALFLQVTVSASAASTSNSFTERQLVVEVIQ